ncbi:MAG: redoxin domain-containing protein [Actinobacteria bacterium]|nr:redoxin domain-containing protein [Actinomycetota bacterium]
MSLEVGTSAPDFTLRNQRREKISLEDLKGERSVIVFIPYAFTSTCQGELCEIRDNLHRFNDAGVRVVAITCNTLHSNGVWAEQQGYTFDILSDFWPHGAVARAFDSFDETFGYAKRTTYFLDDQAVITDVVKSDELGVARPFGEYERILS